MPKTKRNEKLNKTKNIQIYFTEYDMETLKNHSKRKFNERFSVFLKRMIGEATDLYIS